MENILAKMRPSYRLWSLLKTRNYYFLYTTLLIQFRSLSFWNWFVYPNRSFYRVRLYHLHTDFSRKWPELKPFEKMLTQPVLPVSLLKIQRKEVL